jgi:hypothetical protein
VSKRIVVVLMTCLGAFPATSLAEDRADKGVRYIASRLDAPVIELDKGDSQLPLLLETIATIVTEPGADKHPEKKIHIIINEDEFKRVTGGMFDSEKVAIKIRSKLDGMPLSAVLEIICGQIDGGYMVRNDFIEILPVQSLQAELHYPRGVDFDLRIIDRDLRNLVVRFFDNVPLSSAFNLLAEKYNRTILLSPKAQTALEQKVNLRLVNVPFDIAVETLADVAGLKVVRKSNVFVVTTKEQAATIGEEPEKQPKSESPRKDSPKK